MALLSALTSVVSFVFAAMVIGQYVQRRKMYQLVWAIGLAFYGIGALCQYLASTPLWSEAVYRTWYLTGAFYVAAYLGMGTMYLLLPRRVAHTVFAILILGSAYAAVRAVSAPVDFPAVASALREGEISGIGFPPEVRIMTPVFNIFGTIGLVGGAIYSAVIYATKRSHPQRVASNVAIAIGGFVSASGSTLLRFGIPAPFYLSQFAGIVIIFLGFLMNYEVVGERVAILWRPAGQGAGRQ
jgi:hypothetical protein